MAPIFDLPSTPSNPKEPLFKEPLIQEPAMGALGDKGGFLARSQESFSFKPHEDLAKGASPSSSYELISSAFDERYQTICQIVLAQFDREVRLVSRMQLLFIGLLGLESLAAFALFFWLGASSAFALALACIFLTTFISFVTLIYLSTARSHRLIDLRDRFLASCRQHLGYIEGRLDHHLTLAEMLSRLAMEMSEHEYGYLRAPRLMGFLQGYMEALSAWRHWSDVLNFRKQLFESVIEESLSLVRCDPLNIEVHANLANAYALMASLFCDPTRVEAHSVDEPEKVVRWIPPARLSPSMDLQFRHFSSLAVEEFKIIHDFAPEDPWVHAQLAYSYHDLRMPLEEIKSYEALLEICPQDDDARFRLGLLYFQQGMNALGLEMYAALRERGHPKSQLLISFYGRQAVR